MVCSATPCSGSSILPESRLVPQINSIILIPCCICGILTELDQVLESMYRSVVCLGFGLRQHKFVVAEFVAHIDNGNRDCFWQHLEPSFIVFTRSGDIITSGCLPKITFVRNLFFIHRPGRMSDVVSVASGVWRLSICKRCRIANDYMAIRLNNNATCRYHEMTEIWTITCIKIDKHPCLVQDNVKAYLY